MMKKTIPTTQLRPNRETRSQGVSHVIFDEQPEPVQNVVEQQNNEDQMENFPDRGPQVHRGNPEVNRPQVDEKNDRDQNARKSAGTAS